MKKLPHSSLDLFQFEAAAAAGEPANAGETPDLEKETCFRHDGINSVAITNIASIEPLLNPSATPNPQHAPLPAALRHPRATREALLDGKLVGYEIKRGKRRTIGFSVGAEGLAVSAPTWVPLYEIDRAVQCKSSWILKKLHESGERSARHEAARIEWKDGTVFPFLGQPVRLRVDPLGAGRTWGVESENRPQRGQFLPDLQAHSPAMGQKDGEKWTAAVDLQPTIPKSDRLLGTHGVLHPAAWGAADASPGTLHLALPGTATPDQIRNAVRSWLQVQAMAIFTERLNHFMPQLGVQWRKLSLSSAATRWGSASVSGAIRLNWKLLHFSLPVIDYVVVHELSHLRVMDHSPRFWAVVREVIPHYAALRRQLKNEAVARW